MRSWKVMRAGTGNKKFILYGLKEQMLQTIKRGTEESGNIRGKTEEIWQLFCPKYLFDIVLDIDFFVRNLIVRNFWCLMYILFRGAWGYTQNEAHTSNPNNMIWLQINVH